MLKGWKNICLSNIIYHLDLINWQSEMEGSVSFHLTFSDLFTSDFHQPSMRIRMLWQGLPIFVQGFLAVSQKWAVLEQELFERVEAAS